MYHTRSLWEGWIVKTCKNGRAMVEETTDAFVSGNLQWSSPSWQFPNKNEKSSTENQESTPWDMGKAYNLL